MEFTHKLSEIQGLFGNYSSTFQGPTGEYMSLIEEVMKSGKVPIKYKELIFVALSLAQKCDWCLAYHLKLATENGVTEEELNEVAFIALLMAGTPALMESIKLKDYLKDIKNSK